jgi:hypothetical protein
MFQEYFNNIYVLSLVATLIGLSLIYIYDKFEKKQYTSAIYIRFALVLYIATCSTFYLSRANLFNLNIFQGGGGGDSSTDPQSMMPQPNELKSHLEQFKTGTPTF